LKLEATGEPNATRRSRSAITARPCMPSHGEVPLHPPETAGQRLVEYLLRQEAEVEAKAAGRGPRLAEA
jgi:hypothetical protein